ncbi:isoprenoid biosynthesis glyoxalase ElbB [Odoribacter sp. OttesenSCG-928-L07]|nr:isoprenoid biosynthesis glyoxalase ElbB [Odoribacter sp. OttesenSCG-928-L07]MDL2238688.1 isoprenoid biosynthesis glyoxalase ElbB [Bacteroidales bacterium OttesenSCG-928-L14]
MKKFAVILAGCGVKDGSEIHEAVLALYSIKKLGADYSIFAPDVDFHEVNHITIQETENVRNALIEAARIARGNIKPLSEFNEEEFDAMILPGGFGAMKNLCNYAFVGANFEVNKDVKKAVLDMYNAGKPLGFMCIAPLIAAKLIPGCILTIGHDKDTANVIEQLDCEHVVTESGEVCIDRDNNIFSTACYMLNVDIAGVGVCAQNLVEAMLESM